MKIIYATYNRSILIHEVEVTGSWLCRFFMPYAHKKHPLVIVLSCIEIIILWHVYVLLEEIYTLYTYSMPYWEDSEFFATYSILWSERFAYNLKYWVNKSTSLRDELHVLDGWTVQEKSFTWFHLFCLFIHKSLHVFISELRSQSVCISRIFLFKESN